MNRLSIHEKTLIINKRQIGLGYGTIRRQLADENIYTTRQTIKNVCKTFADTGDVSKTRQNPSKFGGQQDHLAFVDRVMSEQPDTSAPTLAANIEDEFGIDVSVRTVRRIREGHGWTRKLTRYCQMVRADNRPIRTQWCQDQIQNNETFDDVIFTDESRIELSDVGKFSYRKGGQPIPRRKKAKHPFAFLLWGGISRRGTTPLIVFNGIMDSLFYQDTILRQGFIPFANAVYPDGHRLYQDNDPKHTSRSTQQFMVENGVNWWKSPAESPDLNPIENIWHEMKDFCIKRRPRNKQDLEDAIHQFWATVTVEKCNRYIDHIYSVMPVCVRMNGDATGM